MNNMAENRRSAHARLVRMKSTVYSAFLDGIGMNCGPATVSARLSLDVMAEVFGEGE